MIDHDMNMRWNWTILQFQVYNILPLVVVAAWVVVAGFSVVVVVGFTVVVVVFSVVVVVFSVVVVVFWVVVVGARSLVQKILFVLNSWVFIL